MINLNLGDCMDAMSKMKDNAYDLAIVDPPYGSSADALKKEFDNSNKRAAKRKFYHHFKNTPPNKDYFKQLYRVSRNCIVWGGNFFGLKGGVIAWNKNGTAFGEGEIALCTTHASVKFFEHTWNGMLQQDMKNKEKRIHPTQKPVALYKWLLKNYAKEGDKILDTHLGSGSIAIACYDGGFSLDAWEIDKEYHAAAVDRYNTHISQLRLL